MEKAKVSVIIPAKNEAPTIGDIIKEAKRHAFEVLVIDGDSQDSTMRIAEEEGAIIFQDSGRNKGEAVRLGLEKARGDVIVLIDGDGSHDARDIPKLVLPVAIENRAELVVASRIKGGSDELNRSFDEYLRFFGSALITRIINMRWRQKLTDAQNGFRAIRSDVAKSLGLEEGPAIDQEIVMSVLKRGFRITEVPSHEYARNHGVSKFALRKVWFKFLYSLVKNLF